MSVDEDTELRDLIVQTLENNGIIGKIKAELRASIFLALDEEDFKNKVPLHRKDLQNYINTKEGQVVISLFEDFLRHFNLEFTLAVFCPEVSCPSEPLKRSELCHILNLDIAKTKDRPVLSELVSMISSQGFDKTGDSQVINKDLNTALNVRERGDEDKQKSTLHSPFINSIVNSDGEKNDMSHIDPFFDDPFPLGNKDPLLMLSSLKDAQGISDTARRSSVSEETLPKGNKSSLDKKNVTERIPFQSSLSSLQDLPSLGRSSQQTNKKSMENLGRKLSELGLDGQAEDDDYEDDDFHSSGSNQSDKLSQKSHEKGQQKSKQEQPDNNSEHSIEEEIEDDLSGVADDLLVSSLSLGDDVTTEQTISQISGSGICDYIENIS